MDDTTIDFVPLLNDVQDAMELLVSDAAFMLFLRLLRYSNQSAYSREGGDGWVRVSVEKTQIERERGRSGRSISTAFKELEDAGAIRREQRGQHSWDTYIRYLPVLAEELLARPSIQQGIRERFSRNVAKVGYLPTFRDVLYGRVEFDEGNHTEWLEARVVDTRNLLFKQNRATQIIAESQQKTTERRVIQDAKRKEKSPAPAGPKADPKDHPYALINYFFDQVQIGLGLRPEAESKKLPGHMKILIARHDADTVRQMIDYVTTPRGWAEWRRTLWQMKDAVVPRLADLLRYDAEIINLMSGTLKPKRSGGAQNYTQEDIDTMDISF
jgi:hypothetical protein